MSIEAWNTRNLTQRDLFFNNTYLLKVSTKDKVTGANTFSIHFYCWVRAYMHLLELNNKEMETNRKTMLLFHVAKFKQGYFCWKYESGQFIASSKHNNALGWDDSPLLVFNLMKRTTPSRPGYTDIMRPIGQCDCGTLWLELIEKSPAWKLQFFCVHLLRRFKDG